MTNCWRCRRVWSGSTWMTFQMSRLTNCSCWKWLSVSRCQRWNLSRTWAEFILITHLESSSSFPERITACLLYLTLPVTVASAERSFSKLKLIKTFLRSTMSQVRLSSLAILSIESRPWKTWTLTRSSIVLLITKPVRSHSIYTVYRIEQWR